MIHMDGMVLLILFGLVCLGFLIAGVLTLLDRFFPRGGPR